jgi:ornithine carrier protein
MATAITADFHPETTPAVSARGREALMDALEDILYGSVSSSFEFLEEYTDV